MKWLAAFLVILNVAAYLLVGGRENTPEKVNLDTGSDVNRTGMLLLGEVDTSQPVGAGLDSSFDGTDSTDLTPESLPVGNDTQNRADEVNAGYLPGNAAAVDEDSIAGSSDQPDAKICYRLGPFKKKESWQAAKMWMNESGIEFRHVTSGSRQLLAYRVYLGPFNSESSADAMVKKLKSEGLEHFLYRAGNGLIRISMGVFSQEELADKLLNRLKTNEYEAKFQPEYRSLGPFNWIEFPLAIMNQAQLPTHDWDESGVRLVKMNCWI